MNKLRKTACVLLLLILASAPVFLYAESPLVPCDGSARKPCDFGQLVLLVKNLINYIFIIAVPIATVMFAYAGFLYLTAAGDTGKISKAHSVFWTVFIGFIIILSAWLIVKAISTLLNPGFSLLGNN